MDCLPGKYTNDCYKDLLFPKADFFNVEQRPESGSTRSRHRWGLCLIDLHNPVRVSSAVISFHFALLKNMLFEDLALYQAMSSKHIYQAVPTLLLQKEILCELWEMGISFCFYRTFALIYDGDKVLLLIGFYRSQRVYSL